MVSIHTPLATTAQNIGLEQGGSNGAAGQNVEQAQSSDQVDSIVSGKASTLSGNNILCQSQSTSECSTSTSPPQFNYEICEECLGIVPHRVLLQIADAYGVVPIEPEICKAIELDPNVDAFRQKLAQAGVERSWIEFLVKCMYLGLI
jgi:hypothetical protein